MSLYPSKHFYYDNCRIRDPNVMIDVICQVFKAISYFGNSSLNACVASEIYEKHRN